MYGNSRSSGKTWMPGFSRNGLYPMVDGLPVGFHLLGTTRVMPTLQYQKTPSWFGNSILLPGRMSGFVLNYLA